MTECIANHKGILSEQYVVLKRTFCFKIILLTCYVAVKASLDECETAHLVLHLDGLSHHHNAWNI